MSLCPAASLWFTLCAVTAVLGSTSLTREVHMGVLLMSNATLALDAKVILPAVDLALDYVNHMLMPRYKIVRHVATYESNCDATVAPSKSALNSLCQCMHYSQTTLFHFKQ